MKRIVGIRKTKVCLLVMQLLMIIFLATACGTNSEENVEASAVEAEEGAEENTTYVEENSEEIVAEVERNSEETVAEVEGKEVEISPEVQAVYMEAVRRLASENVFPNGQEATPDEALEAENMYKIMDVDGDGRAELIINYPNAVAMAGMSYYIFEYNEEKGEFHQELAEFPAVKIYDNGILIAEASHNHGRSSMDDFWPYSVYEYREDTDTYERLAWVDAWEEVMFDGAEPDADFPHEKDTDGDGVIYYFADMETFEPATIMDNDAYREWLTNLTCDAKLLEIEYENLITSQ